jgi:hypothetical protein
MVAIPLLVLGGTEAVLRLAGYGYSTRLFKTLRIGGEEFLVENDQFSLRFFPPELARMPGPVRMKAHKPAGAFRIFILGESAAMGDPEPAYGAGRLPAGPAARTKRRSLSCDRLLSFHSTIPASKRAGRFAAVC